MNPNAYGPPPTNMQQPQAFQQQPASYIPNSGAGGWPSNPMQQQQQPQHQYGGGVPPTSSGPGPAPQQSQQQQPLLPPSMNQTLLNGNYQQQLATSMSGLNMNPMKQAPPMPGATQPMNAINNANSTYPPQMPGAPMPPTSQQQNVGAPIASYQNGPPMPGQQTQQTAGMPPTTSSAINNNTNFNTGYTNGQISKPPTPSMYSPLPTSLSGSINNLPPGQVIPGGVNQMSKNTASVPGLPHMPPPKSSTPLTQIPGQPPIPGQQQMIGQQPGQASMSGQNMSDMPRQPPMPGQHPMGGQPPMQGQHPQPGQSQIPGQPPMPGQQQQQQMPGQSAVLGQQQMAGQPPIPGQSARPGQPPMPGQLQMPGQPPMPGMPNIPAQSLFKNQPQIPGMPTMPGQQGQFPGQQQPQQQQQQPHQQQQQQPHQQQYGQQQIPPRPGQMPMPSQSNLQPGMPPPLPGQMATNYPGSQPGGYPQPPQVAGYPANYNQQPPGAAYQQQYQQQPPRRLDPEQMPNPIQVMIENQRISGGTFVTNQPGLLPPLVTTKYMVQDQGNSSPRYIRSSLYSIPATADLLKTTALPCTLIISPFARTMEGEYEPPIVNFGELGPIRCNRCKAYMSPNMQFIDAGRHFQCLMCKIKTEVPQEYFQHLDHNGVRVDKYERPELVLGTYEFLATKNYCRNNTPPEMPAFIFVIDVSYNTIKSGLVHLLCSQVKNILKNLPIDQGQEKSKVRVGFITYNSTVHFYNIKSTLAQPQMMIVGDIQDMFMPLLDGFLCDPEESEAIIDALMAQIPKMFVDTKETETILYPAIQAGLEALKASNCSGKLLVFNSSLPIAEAPGKLKNRDDRKLLGTDKEKTVLTPQSTAYNTLGQECVQHGCSVDLFLFNNTYIDVATIGQVSRLTGGEVFKYTYFQADSDGKRLVEDIIKNVSRPIAFDAVMRVRTSAGIRATDFYGHFFMTNTTDVELASVDATKSVAVEIKHDDKLPTEENVYIQVALLYTSCSGQRRLRILNLALTATSTIADVFKSSDLDAMMLFFAKQACFKLMELTPKQVKDNLIHRSAQILACYRKHCSSPTSSGQLILPECLKLLPLYISCLLKNDAISGGSDMTLDDRSYVIQFVLSMDLNMSVNYFYPRFIPIHNVDPDEHDLPNPIRCTYEKMSEDGAFILENGVYLFVWLGQSLPQTFIQPLFGVQCTQQVNAERFAIIGDSPLAQRIKDIIDMIMQERTRYMRVIGVRQNDKLESVFRHFLIEDRGTDGSASYVDFLCHMHKEIKDILS